MCIRDRLIATLLNTGHWLRTKYVAVWQQVVTKFVNLSFVLFVVIYDFKYFTKLIIFKRFCRKESKISE